MPLTVGHYAVALNQILMRTPPYPVGLEIIAVGRRVKLMMPSGRYKLYLPDEIVAVYERKDDADRIAKLAYEKDKKLSAEIAGMQKERLRIVKEILKSGDEK